MSNDFDLATAPAYESIEVGDLIQYSTADGTATAAVADFDDQDRPLIKLDMYFDTTLCHIPEDDFVAIVEKNND